MIYRIDIQHYLTHAIDHFTRDDLGVHFEYVIFSAGIKNTKSVRNMIKLNELYPEPETISNYAEYKDKKIMEKMYLETLEPDKDCKNKSSYWSYIVTYNVLINPLLNHQDIMIICQREENDYLDVFCKWLKKNFEIEVIDLNQLFTKGFVGPLYIDRSLIRDKAVDVRRAALNEEQKGKEATSDGRRILLDKMNKKEMKHKVKELEIDLNGNESVEDLRNILIEEWVDPKKED